MDTSTIAFDLNVEHLPGSQNQTEYAAISETRKVGEISRDENSSLELVMTMVRIDTVRTHRFLIDDSTTKFYTFRYA